MSVCVTQGGHIEYLRSVETVTHGVKHMNVRIGLDDIIGHNNMSHTQDLLNIRIYLVTHYCLYDKHSISRNAL